MIVKTPTLFFLLLGALSVLSLVIGYCIATIVERRAANAVIRNLQLKMSNEQNAAFTDLAAARNSIKRVRSEQTSASAGVIRDNKPTLDSPDLSNHGVSSAKERVQVLEAQLKALQSRRHRLQSEFSGHKMSNEQPQSREPSTRAQQRSGLQNETDIYRAVDAKSIPTLMRNANNPVRTKNDDHKFQLPEESAGKDRKRSAVPRLKAPLSRELDIPSLSESQLPDTPQLETREFENHESTQNG